MLTVDFDCSVLHFLTTRFIFLAETIWSLASLTKLIKERLKKVMPGKRAMST